jgi:hypothetical protein
MLLLQLMELMEESGYKEAVGRRACVPCAGSCFRVSQGCRAECHFGVFYSGLIGG